MWCSSPAPTVTVSVREPSQQLASPAETAFERRGKVLSGQVASCMILIKLSSGGAIGVWAGQGSPHFASQALQASGLSDDLTIFTDGGPIPSDAMGGKFMSLAERKGFKFDQRKVKVRFFGHLKGPGCTHIGCAAYE